MPVLAERTIAAPVQSLPVDARRAVERVIELASKEARAFLELLFSGGAITNVPATELRDLARRCGATADDFQAVYRYAVG